MKAAMIGCGTMGAHHLRALRAVGFEVAAVSARPGSARAHAFAGRHGIPHVFDDPMEMLRRGGAWDALVISVPPEAAPPLLRAAIDLGIPALVEKPAAARSADLLPFLRDPAPVIVGYNRRFYPSVQRVRTLAQHSPRPFLANLVLSESAPAGDVPSETLLARRFIENGVHGLDLLRFVLGDLDVARVEPLLDQAGDAVGLVSLLRASRSQSVISFTLAWNAPANVSLSLLQPNLRIQLEPFEQAVVYQEMQRVEPTAAYPLRRYVPVASERIDLKPEDVRRKPGLLQQSQALAQLVLGKPPQDAATLKDAYQALELAERLLGRESRQSEGKS